eukprot:690730-Alexandrium_andersonii.AAC.1
MSGPAQFKPRTPQAISHFSRIGELRKALESSKELWGAPKTTAGRIETAKSSVTHQLLFI